MAGFGGAVKLTGEAEYRQALARIQQNLREVGSQLKVVSTQYAANDNSQAAVTARTEALTAKYNAQQEKLRTLNAQYRAMMQQYTAQNTAHQHLAESLEVEKDKLDQIEKTLGKSSPEYQAQAAAVAKLSSDMDKSTQAVNQNEIAMSKLRTQMNDAQAAVNKTANEMSELGTESEEAGVKAEKAGDGFTVFKGIVANLATSAIQSAIGGIKQMGSALVDLTKQSVSAWSDWEQLSGGVETLFGTGGDSVEQYAQRVGKSVEEAQAEYDKLDAAQTTVFQNANNAWQSAGMSANEYMSTVTGFSASLISSLGGDTQKAAEYADRAVVDMSDNANKMGTNIQDIQNAYQGFAKGNYTMLDNLKIGFGGTTEEAKRLVQEASKMTDVQQKMGVTVDANSMSFDNIVNAIHVMQGSLNIAGDTAEEASHTIEGSVNAMKASWSNLLAELAAGDDLSGALDPFIDSVETMLSNVVPRVTEALAGVGDLAYALVTDTLPAILGEIPTMLGDLLPTLMSTINALFTAIATALPELSSIIGQIIPDVVQVILQNLPMLLTIGLEIIESLAEGIAQSLPTLIGMLPQFISDTVTALMQELPLILQAGVDLLMGLIQGIVQALPQLMAMLPTIITTIVSTLLPMIPQLMQAGVQLLLGIINGIVECLPQLIAMLPTIVSTITTTLMQHLPEIISAGFQILIALINGVVECLPQLIAMLPTIIKTFVQVMTQNLPTILKMGAKILGELILGIGSMLADLRQEVWKIVPLVVNELKELPGKMMDIGKDLIKGLWNGIKDMGSWIKDKIGGFCSGVVDNIKGFFGIHSPSRVMRDQVGKYLAEGIGDGFEEQMGDVSKQMQAAMPSADAFAQTYDAGSVNGSVTAGGINGVSGVNLVDALTEALKNVTVVLDDEVAGRFVTKTVATAIYR